MKKNILSMAVLLMASAAVFTACSSDDNITSEQPANPTGKYTMTVQASKGGDATTRALSLEGKTLNATWATTENVYVKKGDTWAGGSLQPEAAGATATLKGTLTGITPASSDVLTLQFPRSGERDYSGQVGTLEDIAANFDYATATVTVASVSATGNIIPEEATTTFENQQAIVKFTLIDKTDGTTSLSASQLVINDGTTDYTITPASNTSVIYAAIPGFTGKTVTLTATVGSDTYTYEKSGVSFTNGQYYEISVKMTKQATVPEGAISGKFSVSDSKQVYFSKGNLQATYNDSSWSWGFAENQWDYIGNAAGNTSINGNGTVSASNVTVDLFGWVGASNTNTTWSGDLGTTGNAAMHGISNSTATNNTNGYGNNANEALKSDWGNTIGSGWRTLSKDEWTYLFNKRTTGGTVFGTSSARYAHATINTDGTSVNGMILFPDGVDIASTEVTTAGSVNAVSDWGTKCTSAQWSALAAKGCVFLPAAGYRSVYQNKAVVSSAGSDGYYRSSSPDGTTSAYVVSFFRNWLDPAGSGSRYYGESVRLVRDVE